MKRLAVALALSGWAAFGVAIAQPSLPAGYSLAGTYPASSLGLPGSPAGLEFSGDGSLLYVGSPTISAGASVYAVPVTRNPATNQITGFGAGAVLASAPNADSGLQFGPSGTLFFTQWPANGLGEIVGPTTSTFPLPAATGSAGGLVFPPPGAPNAASVLVGSFSSGDLFEVALTNNGNGTYSPSAATLFATLPSGTQGIRYVPTGANAGDILVANHIQGTLSMLEIDSATGLPVGGAATPLVTAWASGIPDVEGLAFDPITSDLFVGTFQGTSASPIYQVTGFPPPPPLTANIATIPVGAASSVVFGLHAGAPNGGRLYLLVGTASGTMPGVPLGAVTLPINLDAVTFFVLENTNMPSFANFFGSTGPTGEASASIALPALGNPSVVGVVLHFAYLLINPIDFASNAVPIVLAP
jgi:hypothetical protein